MPSGNRKQSSCAGLCIVQRCNGQVKLQSIGLIIFIHDVIATEYPPVGKIQTGLFTLEEKGRMHVFETGVKHSMKLNSISNMF